MKARMFIVCIILFVAVYMVYSMAAAGEANAEKETERIKEVLDKALVQCYALEGSYPASAEHLTEYGVIFDNDKYVYYYDMFVTNIKPSVTVIQR